MCGIIAALGTTADLGPAVAALRHRGPDASAVVRVAGVTLGHTRLAIQDLHERSNQPFTDGPVTLAYNGEIFNAPTIRAMVEIADPGRTWRTTGDTEAVAASLSVLGPQVTLGALDGMFALVWADERVPGVLQAARDRHGEVPLHVHLAPPVLVASELKAFTALGRRCGKAAVDVPPGEYLTIGPDNITRLRWHAYRPTPSGHDLEQATGELAEKMAAAAYRRLVADVPICSLLSGGIDSAAIAYELSRHHPGLVCYTAVLDPRARDLRCAREVADALGVKLVEVRVPPPTADDLSQVVARIELPHKAQVEIGWPCLKLAEAMRADGFRVTYTGEGSDELWASYGFAYHGLQRADWHTYRRDLVLAQARKNFQRVNKAFMAYGVEGRLPFLDPDLVAFALDLPRHAVQEGNKSKAVLQWAYTGRLPDEITRRPKVAFQDGMGLKRAVAATLANPGRYYRAEYQRFYG